jgi:hypothetical protein
MSEVQNNGKSGVEIKMAVRQWVCGSKVDLVVEPDSVVELSPFLPCTGCIDVVVLM